MSYFKNLTTEQRQAMREKAAATRRANRLARMNQLTETQVNYVPLKKERKTDRRGDQKPERRARRRAAEQIPVGEEVSLPREILYGSAVEAPDDVHCPPDTVAAADPFQLFLATLDAETKEMLDEDELRRIYAEQLARALAEKKAAKKKAATDLALSAARMSAGLVPRATQEDLQVARRNAELVSATIELPPAGADGQVSDIGLRIDGKVYHHGVRYTFTRAQWDSYREILYRTSQHELEFQGQNTRQRRWILGNAMGNVQRHIALNPDGSLA